MPLVAVPFVQAAEAQLGIVYTYYTTINLCTVLYTIHLYILFISVMQSKLYRAIVFDTTADCPNQISREHSERRESTHPPTKKEANKGRARNVGFRV